jgi:DNA-binding GntR family transcriptional regulator
VYEHLRDGVTHGMYEPGAKFVLDQLARQLGVSTMPIRAALKRLDSDGFVSYRPNKGATVQPLDLDRFIEIQEIRILIEPYAARLGALAMKPEAIDGMRGYLVNLRSGHGTLDDQLAWEWNGYMTCYKASGRQHLIELIRDHGRLAERYTRWAIHGRFEEEAVLDYERFVAACEHRDAERAAETTANGLRRHLSRLVAELKEQT